MMRGLVIASVLLASCTFDFDSVGPRPANDGGSGTGAAGGVGGAGLAQNGGGGAGGAVECVECRSIPEDFDGPYLLKTDSDTCTAVVSGGLTGASVIFPPAAAACGCRCVSTEDYCAQLSVFGTETCSLGTGTVMAPDGTCTTLPGSVMGVRPTAPAYNVSCESDLAAAVVPPLVFVSPVELCDGPTSPACADDLCVPEGRSVCVAGKIGSVCPENFPVAFQVVRPEDFDDSRDCTCGCGTGTLECNTTQVELFKGAACSAPYTESTSSGCVSAAGGGDIVTVRVSYEAMSDCTQESVPTGSVTLEEDSGLQVCCTSDETTTH